MQYTKEKILDKSRFNPMKNKANYNRKKYYTTYNDLVLSFNDEVKTSREDLIGLILCYDDCRGCNTAVDDFVNDLNNLGYNVQLDGYNYMTVSTKPFNDPTFLDRLFVKNRKIYNANTN
jgi:hypothetical protein